MCGLAKCDAHTLVQLGLYGFSTYVMTSEQWFMTHPQVLGSVSCRGGGNVECELWQ